MLLLLGFAVSSIINDSEDLDVTLRSLEEEEEDPFSRESWLPSIIGYGSLTVNVRKDLDGRN